MNDSDLADVSIVEANEGMYAFIVDYIGDTVIKVPKKSIVEADGEEICVSKFANITEIAIMMMIPDNLNLVVPRDVMYTQDIDDIDLSSVAEPDSFSIMMDKATPLRELRESLSRDQRLKMWQSLAIDLLIAVRALVRAGVVHCDIKVDNILAFNNGQSDHYTFKLTDFGIARFLRWGDNYDKNILAQSMPLHMRPPEYMPTLRSHPLINHELDMYCLGIAIYEFVYGDIITDEDVIKMRKSTSAIKCVADLLSVKMETAMRWIATIINKKIDMIEDATLRAFLTPICSHSMKKESAKKERPSAKVLLSSEYFRDQRSYIEDKLTLIEKSVMPAIAYTPMNDPSAYDDVLRCIFSSSDGIDDRNICHYITMTHRYIDALKSYRSDYDIDAATVASAVMMIVDSMLNSHEATPLNTYTTDNNVDNVISTIIDVAHVLEFNFYHITDYEIASIMKTTRDIDTYIADMREHYK